MKLLAYIGLFIICMIIYIIADKADFNQKYDERKRREEEEKKKEEK